MALLCQLPVDAFIPEGRHKDILFLQLMFYHPFRKPAVDSCKYGAWRKKNSECDQRLWKIYLPGIDFHAFSARCIFLSAQTRSAGGFNHVFFVDPPCFSLCSCWFPEEDREKTWRIQGKGCCFSVPVNLVFPFPSGWLEKNIFQSLWSHSEFFVFPARIFVGSGEHQE